MDLERSLGTLNIDESPWRSQHEQTPQPWATSGMPGGGAQSWGGHMSPQQMRNANVWQDPTALAQGVNEALGLGTPGQSGWGTPMGPVAGAGDFETAKIWSDPHMDPQQNFAPMNHQRMNGMMGDPTGGAGGDWMSNQPHQQPIWGDPMKQEQEFFKHQQQGGWAGPPGAPMAGGWPPGPGRMHPNAPPPQHAQRGGMMPRGGPMHGGWGAPNGMMGGPPGKQPMAPWDAGRGMPMHRGVPPGAPRGRYQGGPGGPPAGVDMSVPPPMDMHGMGQPMGGMRQPVMPGGMWKPDPMGGPNGMRTAPNQFNQAQPMYGMPPKPQAAPGQFPIAGQDDLMWHDPNGDLKKWQRDTGVSLWGDPEKCNERPIRLWQVAEGEEEDLEVALMKCPIPQKKGENGETRAPFPIPSKRPIVVTGWGELPENDPNNPTKPEEVPSVSKWGDMSSMSGAASSAEPWFLPTQQPPPFMPEGWGPAASTGGAMPMAGAAPMMAAAGGGGAPAPGDMLAPTQQIAEQLRYACEKGYLDMSILTQASLPPLVLNHLNMLLAKIPPLEAAELELKGLVDSVRPEGETDNNSPQRWMNDQQQMDHNALIIRVTAAKIEVTNLSKKIGSALAEAGIAPTPSDQHSQEYHYSFLE